MTKTKTQSGTSQVPLIKALESAYAALDKKHGLPPVVITVGSGTRPRGLNLGVFYPQSWTCGEKDEHVHQINIGAEGLARGGRDVFGTLVHEAVHGYCELHGIKDTSRQGRYHNKRFKCQAEEFGLVIEHDDRIGWSLTTVPDELAKTYAKHIAAIDDAITHYRVVKPKQGKDTKTQPAATCECPEPRKIRVAPRTLEAAPITCGLCGADFEIRD